MADHHVEDRAHSRLGASGAHRWMHCPGSIALGEKAPDKAPSIYAATGTVAHEIGENCLRLGVEPKDFLGDTFHCDGFGIEVDDEMAEAVEVYVNFIHTVAPPAYKDVHGFEVFVERQFSLPEIHQDLGGTADCVITYPPARAHGGTLMVIDYKHGSGVTVEAENNPQLMIYALGALSTFPDQHFSKVRIVIVQPRGAGESVKDWWINVEALKAWGDSVLRAATKRVDEAPEYNAGDHCRFCDAKALCSAHEQRALEVARTEFGVCDFPQPDTLDLPHVAKVLQFAELMSDWVQQVKAHAQSCMEQGEDIPGYKLVRRRSLRRWKDEAEAEAVLKEHVDPYKKTLVSPAQAEKLVKDKGVDISSLWEKPDNGLVIAPADDKRAAVACNSSVEDFVDQLEMFQ